MHAHTSSTLVILNTCQVRVNIIHYKKFLHRDSDENQWKIIIWHISQHILFLLLSVRILILTEKSVPLILAGQAASLGTAVTMANAFMEKDHEGWWLRPCVTLIHVWDFGPWRMVDHQIRTRALSGDVSLLALRVGMAERGKVWSQWLLLDGATTITGEVKDSLKAGKQLF